MSELQEENEFLHKDGADENVNPGLSAHENDPVFVSPKVSWRHWYKTACLYISMVTEGAAIAILGPCLLDLELLYDKDTSTLSSSFIGHRVGFILGTILAGFLYHRFNRDLQMFLGTFLIAVFTCIATHIGGFIGFVGFLLCQGVSMGYVTTGITPYLLELWQGHPFKNPLLQGTHAAMMLGYSIGPLIVDPFLVDTHSDPLIIKEISPSVTPDILNTTSIFSTDINNTLFNGRYQMGSKIPENESQPATEHDTYVQFGFLVIGLISCATVLLWLLAFTCGNKHLMSKTAKGQSGGVRVKSHTSGQEHATLFFLATVSFMMLSYMIQETAVVVFLPSYVVKSLEWSKHHGSLIATVFWAMVCTGRVTAIPMSAFVRPYLIILLDIITSVVSASLLLLGTFVPFPTPVTWISAAFLGLGFSSFWATAFLWTASFMPVEGRVSAVYHVLGSIGAIVAPFITGHMFQYYTPKSLVYIVFASAVFSLALFVLAYICTKHMKSLRMDMLKEVNVPDEKEISLNPVTTQGNST